MDLHPSCEPLAFLLGVWKGAGEGHYPTIESFRYNEEVTFGHVGKTFLSYMQKTKHAETGEPLHAEAGYVRPVEGGGAELVVVQPSGIVELHTGVVTNTSIAFSSIGVHTTPTAKTVTQVTRSLMVDDLDGMVTLTYDVEMAAVGQPLTHHLSASLVRQTNG